MTLTAEHLREMLHYDRATGLWTWIKKPCRNVRIGSRAGSVFQNGYVYISLEGRKYLASRLAWFYEHGEWPAGKLDHRSTVRTHNALDNLRPASNSQNAANSKRRSTNTSGFKGVSFDRSRGKYQVHITVDYQQRFLGRFDTVEAGHAAYALAAREAFGEFARLE